MESEENSVIKNSIDPWSSVPRWVINSIAFSGGLTPLEKVALIYMIDKPDGWTFRQTEFLKILSTKEGKMADPKTWHKVSRGLIDKGHITRNRRRALDGSYETVYEVHPTPEPNNTLRSPEPNFGSHSQKTDQLDKLNSVNNNVQAKKGLPSEVAEATVNDLAPMRMRFQHGAETWDKSMSNLNEIMQGYCSYSKPQNRTPHLEFLSKVDGLREVKSAGRMMSAFTLYFASVHDYRGNRKPHFSEVSNLWEQFESWLPSEDSTKVSNWFRIKRILDKDIPDGQKVRDVLTLRLAGNISFDRLDINANNVSELTLEKWVHKLKSKGEIE